MHIQYSSSSKLAAIRSPASLFWESPQSKHIRGREPRWHLTIGGVLSIVEAMGDSSLAPRMHYFNLTLTPGGDLWLSLNSEKRTWPGTVTFGSIGVVAIVEAKHQRAESHLYCTRSWNRTQARAGGSYSFTALLKVVNFTQGWST